MHSVLLVEPGRWLKIALVLALAACDVATQLLQSTLHFGLLSHFLLFSGLVSGFIDPFGVVLLLLCAALVRFNQLFVRRARQRGHLTDLLGLDGGDVCVGSMLGGFVNADLLAWLLCGTLLLGLICDDRLQRLLLPLVLLSLAVLSGLRRGVFLLRPAILPPRIVLVVDPYINSG